MTTPTPRMVRIWEALQAHGGNQTATARSLGITQGNVRSAMLGYLGHTGEDAPVGGRRPNGSGPVGIARRELADAKAQAATLAARVADLERGEQLLAARITELQDEVAPWRRIEDKLDQLLARPQAIAFQPDHRRIADGGTHPRRQKRQARTA